jgi:cytochrome c553
MARQTAPARICQRGRRKTPSNRGNSATRLIATLLLANFPMALGIFSSPAAENSQGAQLAAMCASCHRLDGQDKGIPSIIGLDENKLVGMMAEFESSKRKSQIMGVVARSLSDEEVAEVARYLATRQKGAEQP